MTPESLPRVTQLHRIAATLPLITAFALAACADSSQSPVAPDAPPLYAKAGGGGGASAVVVKSNIADGYSIASDGFGDYLNGVKGVVSNIQAIGDWVLENNSSKSTRSTLLDLSNVVSGSAPFASKLVKGRFISKITDVGGTYQAMQLGQTTLVPLSFAFADGGKSYGLRFNPINQPGSEYARATCTAAVSTTNNACALWELTPSGTDGTSLAILQDVSANATVATVRMSFKITFRR